MKIIWFNGKQGRIKLNTVLLFSLILLLVFSVNVTPESETSENEIISERTYNSKTYSISDNLRQAKIHLGHIHYKNASDELTNVNYTLVDKGTYWQMKKASYKIFINKNFSDSSLIRFDNKFAGADHTIYYEPHSIWWINANNINDRTKIIGAQNVIGTVSENKITYKEAFGSCLDFEITLLSSGFKKELVINNKSCIGSPPSGSHRPVILFRYTGDGLTVKATNNATSWDGVNYYKSLEGYEISEVTPKFKSFVKHAYIVDANKTMQKLEIYWIKEAGILWQAKVIPINFVLNNNFPMRADTTTTYYSDTSDGSISLSGTTWGEVRDNSTGSYIITNCANDDCDAFRTSPAATYRCYRTFLNFNTSSLPDNAVITNVSLHVNATGRLFTAGQDLGVNVVETNVSNPASMTLSDYGTVQEEEGSDNRVNVATWKYSGWESFVFNATGIAWVNVTGWTKLSLREGHDLDNVTPDGHSIGKHYFSDAAGTKNDPYLNITYTIPSADSCTTIQNDNGVINDGTIHSIDSSCEIHPNILRIYDGGIRISSTGSFKAAGCYVTDSKTLYVEDGGGLYCGG